MTTVHPRKRLRVELPARSLTLDDVSELAAADDIHRYELIDGTLLVMPPADVDHARVIVRLAVWFVNHGYDSDLILPTAGLRVRDRSGGRSPDLLVLRRPVEGATVWVDAEDTLLAVEVVSTGSASEDRMRKPIEYATAGVPHFWRVERSGGASTVHAYVLGSDERGEPAYVNHEATLLDDLLAAPPPALP